MMSRCRTAAGCSGEKTTSQGVEYRMGVREAVDGVNECTGGSTAVGSWMVSKSGSGGCGDGEVGELARVAVDVLE